MDVSTTPVAERIARVLAGQRISANAGGDAESAGDAVDAAWRDYLADARAVLRTLREPDRAMAAAGDPADSNAEGAKTLKRRERSARRAAHDLQHLESVDSRAN